MDAFDQNSTVVHGLPVSENRCIIIRKKKRLRKLYIIMFKSDSQKIDTVRHICIYKYQITRRMIMILPRKTCICMFVLIRLNFLAVLASFGNLEYISANRLKEKNMNMVMLFRKVVENFRSEQYGYEFLMRSGVLEIMTYVFRECSSDIKNTAVLDTLEFPEKEVEDYISANYQAATLAEVANHFSFSCSYFS